MSTHKTKKGRNSALRLSEQNTVRLIQLYASEPCLYDVHCGEYKRRESRDAALERVADAFAVEGFGPKEIANKFKNLRNSFSQELKKMEDGGYVSKVYWFDVMDSFLRPQMYAREHMDVYSTRNGRPCLVLGGYQYRLQKKCGSSLRWLCLREKRERCRGSLMTDVHVRRVVSRREHACVRTDIGRRRGDAGLLPGIRVAEEKAAAATSSSNALAISLEPEIIIKEEPIDEDEIDADQPSTSRTEFILPNSSTASASTPTLGVAYSIADIKKEKSTSPLSNGGKSTPTKAKRKGKTSARGKKLRLESDVADETVSTADHASSADSVSDAKDRPKDQFDAYGEYIAAKLRKLDWKSCAYVQKAIGDIMFEAEMGKFKENSP